MKNTRQLIIDFIASKKRTTILEISQAFNVTPANIRHHIHFLAREGVVESIGFLSSEKPGRPALFYSLSQLSKKHNFDRLASALLEESFLNSSIENRNQYLKSVAKILCGRKSPSDTVISQSMYKAINRLNDMNYQAHWEAHANSPRIILSHCPYMLILSEHPELCQLDQFLLQELTSFTISQIAKLEKDSRGNINCLFIINKEF